MKNHSSYGDIDTVSLGNLTSMVKFSNHIRYHHIYKMIHKKNFMTNND